MFKFDLCSWLFKSAKKYTVNLSKPNNNIFLTFEVKKLFQKLKRAFCKESVLQYFDMSKPVRLEIEASRKSIRAVYTKKIMIRIGTWLLIICARCTLLSEIMKLMMLNCWQWWRTSKLGVITLVEPLIIFWC